MRQLKNLHKQIRRNMCGGGGTKELTHTYKPNIIYIYIYIYNNNNNTNDIRIEIEQQKLDNATEYFQQSK